MTTKQQAEDAIRTIFDYIGENPEREGLVGTPDRITRMLREICRGYIPSEKPHITTFNNGSDGLDYNGIIMDQGEFYSLCEHHMMPFFGRYYFAYIPNPKGKVLGLSKVGRVVDYCAAKLQVQERLTKEIIDIFTQALGDENPPLGMALCLEGEHLCKTMRGARKKGNMKTSIMTGVFDTDASVREKFYEMINQK
ncbi:MAG: GTP cyclohydrolase I [Bacteroidales bacterium]|nr:GTP cyclohydrolase I [Bacteroidales bacterium]